MKLTIQNQLADLRAKGGAGAKAADEKERLMREAGEQEREQLLQVDVDGDGTVELHEFMRVRAFHVLNARGAALPSKRRNSVPAIASKPAEEEPPLFCSRCGRQFISSFCTGCGSPRNAAGDDKKIVVAKKKKKKSTAKSPRGKARNPSSDEEL